MLSVGQDCYLRTYFKFQNACVRMHFLWDELYHLAFLGYQSSNDTLHFPFCIKFLKSSYLPSFSMWQLIWGQLLKLTLQLCFTGSFHDQKRPQSHRNEMDETAMCCLVLAVNPWFSCFWCYFLYILPVPCLYMKDHGRQGFWGEQLCWIREVQQSNCGIFWSARSASAI